MEGGQPLLREVRRGDASAWFRRGALPEIPRKGSIARMMLDAWSEGRI